MTDEQVHYNQRKMLAKRKLTEIGMPKRIAGPIAWYGKEDSLWRAIDDDFGKWSADVLAGNYDADLLSLHQFGEKNLADLKDFLRQSPRAPAPLCIQPGPASKANEKAAKPSGVSFSIHVSDPYHAAALGYIADMLDSQIADHPVIEWLAYILDHFVDSSCGWHTEDDAVNDLIRAMEKTIKFLRTE